MKTLLACYQLNKTYGRGMTAERALAGITIALPAGVACVVLGPSGSGKTTLLSILGCLLTPTSGRVAIEGQPVLFGRLGKLALLRRRLIGFVFQHAHLLPFLSIEDNLRIVGRNCGLSNSETHTRLDHLIAELGISTYRRRKPGDLSGGQRQRVAIARALIHRPPIILADEPTAALDWENGQAAIRLLISQAKCRGAALIVVTHDTRMVGQFDRALYMESGRILTDAPAGSISTVETK